MRLRVADHLVHRHPARALLRWPFTHYSFLARLIGRCKLRGDLSAEEVIDTGNWVDHESERLPEWRNAQEQTQAHTQSCSSTARPGAVEIRRPEQPRISEFATLL